MIDPASIPVVPNRYMAGDAVSIFSDGVLHVSEETEAAIRAASSEELTSILAGLTVIKIPTLSTFMQTEWPVPSFEWGKRR